MNVKRRNQNLGKYCGETIDIKLILNEIKNIAASKDWDVQSFYQNKGFDFLALVRRGEKNKRNIYISAGIHGDEPAGPLTVLELLKEDDWGTKNNIWICPVLNPIGFTLNTRENEKGCDLNRDYKNPKMPEVAAHIAWLQKQPRFDISLGLHEDWESSGFYVFDHGGPNSKASSIIKEVSKIFPINTDSIIEDFKAKDGVVRPKLNLEERKEWLENFYIMWKQDSEDYVFEAASDYPLEARVKALMTAVRTTIDNLK